VRSECQYLISVEHIYAGVTITTGVKEGISRPNSRRPSYVGIIIIRGMEEMSSPKFGLFFLNLDFIKYNP